MHLDLELGKRHFAVFLGSVAALIALALTPQLLGDLVSEGMRVSPTPRPAGFGSPRRVRRLDRDRRPAGGSPRSPAAAARCPDDASARFCTGSIVNALAPARIGTTVRSGSSRARSTTRGGSGRSAGSPARSAPCGRCGSPSCSRSARRAACCRGGRSLSCCSQGGRRAPSPGVLATRGRARSSATPSTSSASSALPQGRGTDHRLGRALDGPARRRRGCDRRRLRGRPAARRRPS